MKIKTMDEECIMHCILYEDEIIKCTHCQFPHDTRKHKAEKMPMQVFFSWLLEAS